MTSQIFETVDILYQVGRRRAAAPFTISARDTGATAPKAIFCALCASARTARRAYGSSAWPRRARARAELSRIMGVMDRKIWKIRSSGSTFYQVMWNSYDSVGSWSAPQSE
ncbi:MAG: hypothetical protein EON58_01940 [Alphaproteobacteria bacterium]|nr:MAG: hypothetical protein EON58_01940 [Alphaproteobacteria bacterium]